MYSPHSMLQAGADVNAGQPVTPLIVAATAGFTDCIKCLLKADADANIPDNVSFILLFGLFVVTHINVVDCQSIAK